MLTVAAVKAARPQPRAYLKGDTDGLRLRVAPTGTKSWQLRYRIAGREKLLTIGQYPILSLDDARARRDVALAELAAGRDPAELSAPMTFEAAARRWISHRLEGWSPGHAAEVAASLERDVFPAIGAKLVDQVTAPDLVLLLRAIERRGRRATARRVLQRLGSIFAFAISEGWCAADPSATCREALRVPPAPGRQPAILELGRARELLALVDQLAAAPIAKLASTFLALTGVRLAALRGARWSEIEDLDGPAPQWRVPAARMKLGTERKLDSRYDHVVPLAPAAVAVLRAARAAVSDIANMHAARANMHSANADMRIFPGRGGGELPEDAIAALYDRAGFAGEHVPHGWRATFSTILNEELGGAWRAAIDQALGHAPKDKVEAAYNRSQQLGRRREILERWAELLMGPAPRA